MKTKLHILFIIALSLLWLILPQVVCRGPTYYLDAANGNDSNMYEVYSVDDAGNKSVSAEIGAFSTASDSHNITIGPNNELIIGGEKFFPIFVWNQRISGLNYLKNLGINTIVGYDGGDGPVINWLDAGQARGIYMVPHVNYLDATTADHPALLAALICHEPELGSAGPKEYPSEIQAREDNFKSQFPGIPTINLLTACFYDYYRSRISWMNGDYSWYDQYMALGDIISYDHYPITGWNKPERIYELGAATNEAYVAYLSKSKPVWPIIEASDQDLSWTAPETRGPYDYEMRAEAWLSIVNGAKAIGYFTIAFNPFSYNRLTPQIEAEMIRTNSQITGLKDIVLAEDPTDVSVNVTATNGLTVQTMVKKYNNKIYIFAVEGDSSYDYTDRKSGVATFTVNRILQDAYVTVYDESRALQATGNNFTDTFDELGVHIYITDLGSPVNQAPTANAGSDQTLIDEDNDGEEQVTLDGSASRDPDGTIVSLIWSEGNSQLANGINPTVTLSTGEHLITLTVADDGGLTDTDTVTIKVLREDKEFGELPADCYNNLFNPLKGEKAIIVVELSKQAQVRLDLYNARGHRIRELANEEKEAGTHKYYWDGRSGNGDVVGSGLYFVHIQVGDYKKTKKIVVVK
ncbi:MAG TPA: PKD domain-containing protein [bacterium]|nr:PKD domain-containing protein [bacterium]